MFSVGDKVRHINDKNNELLEILKTYSGLVFTCARLETPKKQNVYGIEKHQVYICDSKFLVMVEPNINLLTLLPGISTCQGEASAAEQPETVDRRRSGEPGGKSALPRTRLVAIQQELF